MIEIIILDRTHYSSICMNSVTSVQLFITNISKVELWQKIISYSKRPLAQVEGAKQTISSFIHQILPDSPKCIQIGQSLTVLHAMKTILYLEFYRIQRNVKKIQMFHKIIRVSFLSNSHVFIAQMGYFWTLLLGIEWLYC